MLDPTRPLNDIGFLIVCAYELKRHWPDITLADAAREMQGFAGVPVGTPGYDWSMDAAAELARQYAEQFGEVA